MAIVETPPCKWTPPVCNDSVNLHSPSSDVDGVSNSPYTSNNLRTDGQPEAGRGLPPIDDREYPERPIREKGTKKVFKYKKLYQLPWARIKKAPPCKYIPPIEEP